MSAAAPAPPAIELRGVSVMLRGQRVLDDVSLTVEDGDMLALLGPNGGGKTTLLRVVLGLVEPDAGSVRVYGQPPRRAAGRVGYVPQTARFDADFPIRVLDVVRMGRLRARGFGRRFGPRDTEIAREALRRVELEPRAEDPIGSLSGGQLQRALIARALAQEPQLLLLDEPTASLDERIGRSVWSLFDTLAQGMTVVLVSHDIGAISRTVGSVACLNRTLHAHPSKALTPEVLEAAYGCPVDLLAHGHPHRVLGSHGEPGNGEGGP